MTAMELHRASAKIKGKCVASYNREIPIKGMAGSSLLKSLKTHSLHLLILLFFSVGIVFRETPLTITR